MREIISLNENWTLSFPKGERPTEQVTLPHTWNAVDGMDGNGSYLRTTGVYTRTFTAPKQPLVGGRTYIEVLAAALSATVKVNGTVATTHEGGYSIFRADVTDLCHDGENELTIEVSNEDTPSMYPSSADFTFYGGLYRGVNLISVPNAHFDLDYYGGPGIKVTPKPTEDGGATFEIESWVTNGEEAYTVMYSIEDCYGNEVASGVRPCDSTKVTLYVPDAQLWSMDEPNLYTVIARLQRRNESYDDLYVNVGVRSYTVTPDGGFSINGVPTPLRGVSRHQDRKGLGNAITREMHDEDMALIRELGANTVRLAHYQHDQYFYDLCDQYGMVVWAEIPYISEHLPNGRENTISQMKELIHQNYNHPSIVCWGVSNEITISTKDKADMLDNHRVLNELCHKMDPTRLTTLACYAMCGPFNPVAHITDLVSWNLYLGWYVPGLFLNDLWMDFFHLVYPNRPLGFSEYGAEGMPNLHSAHPRRGDHTEEYQAKYHEYMLKCFDRHPWLWATHVWNMFDFAADARDQGGEPGMNHKGLVTFDRKTKKDSFYLYKAWWSEENFVHICSKRFTDRTEKEIEVKVYSNQHSVALYADGKKLAEQTGEHIFKFRVPLHGKVELKAVAGDCIDTASFCNVAEPNPSYKLVKTKSKSANWV